MVAKVIDIKTKSRTFEDWLQEVIKLHKMDDHATNVTSAAFFWESKDEEGNPIARCARFNADLAEMDWYRRCVEETCFNMKMAEWMSNNINQFIQYIGD